MRIKWRVGEKPTGPYRSFFFRSWPTGWVNGHLVFAILCEESYVPARALEGAHPPLQLRQYRRSITPEEIAKHGSRYSVIYKTTFLDLEGAKSFAVERLASDTRLQADILFWDNQAGT